MRQSTLKHIRENQLRATRRAAEQPYSSSRSHTLQPLGGFFWKLAPLGLKVPWSGGVLLLPTSQICYSTHGRQSRGRDK